MANSSIIIKAEKLIDFCTRVFVKMGVTPADAKITSEILLKADLRGIHSHGIARIGRYYYGLKDGIMFPKPEIKTLRETPVSQVIDAGAGLGQPVSKYAMEKAIEKAQISGACFVTVRNSNHYGIAGYYSMMALEHDMMGICLTNSSPMVVPTFGRQALYGTNPIAVAIPAGEEKPFVLDMATTIVPRGKLEVYERKEQPLPSGWTIDEHGKDTADASLVLKNVFHRLGGGLLPLGGVGELYSGYKGYGLGLLVEILTGVLTGAAFADDTYPMDEKGNPLPPNIGHFFGAVRIDLFRDPENFKEDMDILIRKFKNSNKADRESRIYIHGEKEFEKEEQHKKEGVPVHKKVIETMKTIAEETGIEFM